MSTSPRILRVVPRGPVTRPEHPLPVFATLRWANGTDGEVPAIAVAWTREAVEIEWEPPDSGLRSDWIPARDVRRPGNPSLADDAPPIRATRRPRW